MGSVSLLHPASAPPCREGSHPRPVAASRYADWINPFWLEPAGLDAAGQPAYAAGMAPFDPITAVPAAAPAALLFQFAQAGVCIPEAAALAFYAAASEL